MEPGAFRNRHNSGIVSTGSFIPPVILSTVQNAQPLIGINGADIFVIPGTARLNYGQVTSPIDIESGALLSNWGYNRGA